MVAEEAGRCKEQKEKQKEEPRQEGRCRTRWFCEPAGRCATARWRLLALVQGGGRKWGSRRKLTVSTRNRTRGTGTGHTSTVQARHRQMQAVRTRECRCAGRSRSTSSTGRTRRSSVSGEQGPYFLGVLLLLLRDTSNIFMGPLRAHRVGAGPPGSVGWLAQLTRVGLDCGLSCTEYCTACIPYSTCTCN